MNALRHVIAIDPGTAACGVALFSTCAVPNARTVPRPVAARTFTASRGKPWEERADDLIHALNSLLAELRFFPTEIAIEFPTNRHNAATAKGDTLQLAYFAGLCRVACSTAPTVALIIPQAWKGSLSKAVTEKRIRAAYPGGLYGADEVPYSSHALDAVGVGLFHLGFKINNAKYFNPKKRAR